MQNTPIVRLENVTVLQSGSPVLTDVQLLLEKGEFVYLIGKTGSGKSSLLKLLYGEIRLSEGEGTVAGFNLGTLSMQQVPFLRRKLGIVFQDFQLLSDRDVRSNLEFVLSATGWSDRSAMDARIEEVLQLVGLSTKGFKLPHELSGGEQQRVVIARAFLNHPELILADEPTGNLDPETSEGIMRLLLDISRRGTAVLMATHNYSLMEKFPARTLRCEQGRLTESGTLSAA
ncbi:MAG: cell division ATP-binding protein FtsE [Bacteroidota bacterium]